MQWAAPQMSLQGCQTWSITPAKIILILLEISHRTISDRAAFTALNIFNPCCYLVENEAHPALLRSPAQYSGPFASGLLSCRTDSPT
jgi:hypothetical protein